MKRIPLLLTLVFLSPLLGLAQTTTGSESGPGLTVTPTVSSTSVNPNRQQELYDQYNGITKKTRTDQISTPLATVIQTQPNTPVRPRPDPRPERVERPAKPARVVSKSERIAPTSIGVSTSGVRIGFRGGVTFPAFLEAEPGIDPRIGFTGGIVFQFGSGAVSFQPEINYTRNAYKLNQTDPFGGAPAFSQRYASDLVEIPFLLKIATGNVNGSRFFVNVGPYVAYLLSQSQNGKNQSLERVNGRFGVGAAAGIGAALKAGPGHLTIELRGLYDLGDTANGFSTDSKTIGTQATLGYMIPLGGR